MTSLTADQIDEVLEDIGSLTLIDHKDLPEWLDLSGVRMIRDEKHEKAIRYGGETVRYAERNQVVNRLLDLRNEIAPPITSISDEGDE